MRHNNLASVTIALSVGKAFFDTIKQCCCKGASHFVAKTKCLVYVIVLCHELPNDG